jgi:acyl-CoA reductase-like NAD-dependent aldehyde dehydrogenase
VQQLIRMNDSAYGLTASIWTADMERAERFGAGLRVGRTDPTPRWSVGPSA